MQEITLWQDWLLLCSAARTGLNVPSLLGLVFDLAGFIILIKAAKDTIASVKKLNAEILNIEFERLNNNELKKMP